MNRLNIAFLWIILTIILSMFQKSFAQKNWSIELDTAKKQIKYADPFILNLKLVFQQPHISQRTGKPSGVLELRELVLNVQNQDTNETYLFPFRLPVKFNLLDTEGLEYISKVMIFYDLYEEKNKIIKEIIFDKSGAYRLTIFRETEVASNALDIEVKPSNLGRLALSLLTDPNDLAFLIGGIYKNPKTISHLEEMVSKCEGTVLSQMAASRLGLEYFKEFHAKHPSFEKFKALRKESKVQEPIFEQARKYLAIGFQLPDEFPIREEVLYQLSRTEAIDSNYDRALTLLDELAKKYQYGEYGKKAINAKEELQTLRKHELEQAEKP